MTQELITQLHELSRKLRSNGDIDACILVEKAYDTIYRQDRELTKYSPYKQHTAEHAKIRQKQ